MRRRRLSYRVSVFGILFLAVVWADGFVAEKAPFYQGKTLTFIINFAAGGPTDIEGRIFARHLSKHIPGQPGVVVQNMGGAGGLTAVNYMGDRPSTL